MQLVIATRNRHKLEEIQALLNVPGLHLSSALDYPGIPDVEETGATFEENARLKAVALQTATGCWALADDSGLEVDALNGAPGVYSARFAGEPPDYAANNRKLLAMLDGETNRRARFRTALCLASPDGTCRIVEGRCEGAIIEAPRGEGGFGYDPIFVPEGETLTFAEMPAERKNEISHRARALAAAHDAWADLLRKA
ncbi:MAG TPA: XTP/dITP diphosphatase [Kiritimatiellia bacterium]|nr:XTP/dITP diphosphatase [Kiritimatiellia bacterium]